jgi:hypothetical protein
VAAAKSARWWPTAGLVGPVFAAAVTLTSGARDAASVVGRSTDASHDKAMAMAMATLAMAGSAIKSRPLRAAGKNAGSPFDDPEKTNVGVHP